MMAAFLDENLPDGTRLRPGTKFIKYWKMRNTGTVSWNADTKVNKDGPPRYSIQYSINSNNDDGDTDPNHVRNIRRFSYVINGLQI